MNLVIDIGNSACKMAISRNGVLGCVHRVLNNEIIGMVDNIIAVEGVPDIIAVSSVAGKDFSSYKELASRCRMIINLGADTALPIKNLYKTPSTLGADRLAAVVGAYSLFPKKNCIIFDFGTAVTIDILSERGEYIGGNISLGLLTRFKAINQYTKQLPLVSKEGDISLTGGSTEEAIRNGVILGIMFEVEGYISKHPGYQAIFTGGDAFYFAEKMKNPIFAVFNLVLIGLSHIADYYATK